MIVVMYWSVIDCLHVCAPSLDHTRRPTHHGRIEEDEDSRAQQRGGTQNEEVVDHAQHGHQRPPSQETAYHCRLVHPLPITRAHVDQLRAREGRR